MGLQLGRYELLEPLARGGMAEVFLARRRGPGGVEKQLVVKRIARDKSRDPRFAEMFVSEARLSMSLAHKNIVPVFDFGRAGDELFLVMEYVDGIDMGRALKRSRELDVPISPVLLAYIGMEAAEALDYAHTSGNESQSGVIHRDVTPGNVLVSSSGEVKLVDFGVAALASDSLGDGKVRGTPSYMSPEQAFGKAVDGRSDLFSLGLLLWEAASGRRAYGGETASKMLEQARGCQLPALPEEIPEALRKIIEKATAADPEERYQSAREMHRALDRFLVAARAQADDDAPPSNQLATWVREIRPRKRSKRSLPSMPAPAGEVVTYLAVGPEKVGTIAGPGEATALSMAATVGELSDAALADTALEESGEGKSGESRPQPPSWRIWALGAAAIAGLGITATVVLSSTSDEGDQPAVASIDAGAAPVDATSMVATIDAAGPAEALDATPDAATAPDAAPRRRVTADAGRRKPARPDAGVKATGKPGTVRISTAPWARVTVAGRPEGCAETPCQLTLPAGRYTLILENPVSKVGARVEVEVQAGKVATVRKGLTR
jgi:serine/threonine protein kinase